MTSTTKDAVIDKAEQLPLALPAFSPNYEPGSFIVSESNEAAWLAARKWQTSDESLLIICGPKGSGKSYLAKILADQSGCFCDGTLSLAKLDSFGVFVFDNLPSMAPQHLLNYINDITQHGRRVVLVGNGRPSLWADGLKDLVTRIESAPRVEIEEPDEALIRAVIAKEFRDRQLEVGQAIIDYAVPRLPRTFAAAHEFVARADDLALSEKRSVTVPLAQKLVDRIR